MYMFVTPREIVPPVQTVITKTIPILPALEISCQQTNAHLSHTKSRKPVFFSGLSTKWNVNWVCFLGKIRRNKKCIPCTHFSFLDLENCTFNCDSIFQRTFGCIWDNKPIKKSMTHIKAGFRKFTLEIHCFCWNITLILPQWVWTMSQKSCSFKQTFDWTPFQMVCQSSWGSLERKCQGGKTWKCCILCGNDKHSFFLQSLSQSSNCNALSVREKCSCWLQGTKFQEIGTTNPLWFTRTVQSKWHSLLQQKSSLITSTAVMHWQNTSEIWNIAPICTHSQIPLTSKLWHQMTNFFCICKANQVKTEWFWIWEFGSHHFSIDNSQLWSFQKKISLLPIVMAIFSCFWVCQLCHLSIVLQLATSQIVSEKWSNCAKWSHQCANTLSFLLHSPSFSSQKSMTLG